MVAFGRRQRVAQSQQSYAVLHNGDYDHLSTLTNHHTHPFFFFFAVCMILPGGGSRLQTLGGLAAQWFDSTLRTYFELWRSLWWNAEGKFVRDMAASLLQFCFFPESQRRRTF